MTDLPAPLTTPDCDLRGMEWMPLYGNRLFMSDFEARATDVEFRIAIRLWWTAWQQVPAASLPNDDAVLCKLAGLGRDLKTWKKLREGFAMHGFVECSDGRLYHRVLSKEAREAWDRRMKERERKAAYRAKKYGTGLSGPMDGPRDSGGTSTGQDADVPQMSQRDARIDKTRQDKTGQDSTPLPPYDLEGVSPSRDGRPAVNGWYLDRTWERVAEAARIDAAKWRGNITPLVGWLKADIEPDTIVAAIKRVASRPNYASPGTLQFFDAAVREQRVAA